MLMQQRILLQNENLALSLARALLFLAVLYFLLNKPQNSWCLITSYIRVLFLTLSLTEIYFLYFHIFLLLPATSKE